MIKCRGHKVGGRREHRHSPTRWLVKTCSLLYLGYCPLQLSERKKKKRKIIRNKAENDTHQYNANDKWESLEGTEIWNVVMAFILEAVSQWWMAKIRIICSVLPVSQNQPFPFKLWKGYSLETAQEFCPNFKQSTLISNWLWTFHLRRLFCKQFGGEGRLHPSL